MNKAITMIFLLVANVQVVSGQQHNDHKQMNHKHHHNHAVTKPMLNQGAKWVMDDHTRNMFIAMKQRVDAGGDLQNMGAKLNDDLKKLIQGCTMTGEAHDQLHVFLLPYMSSIQALSETGSPERLKEVEQALLDYQKFFE